MRFKISPSNQLGQEIARGMNELFDALDMSSDSTTSEVVEATMDHIQGVAENKLKSTKMLYLNSIDYERVGKNKYVITLNPEAQHLETGYEPFNMLQAGLARGPKSKLSKPKKNGGAQYRYVRIPFQQETGLASAQPDDSRANRQVQKNGANPISMRDLQGKAQSYLQKAGLVNGSGKAIPVKDASGSPVYRSTQKTAADGSSFKRALPVAVLGPNPHNANSMRVYDMTKVSASGQNPFRTVSLGEGEGDRFDSRMHGLMVIQYPQKSKGGKERSMRKYMTIRTASENPAAKGKFEHPGFAGIKAFDSAELFAQKLLYDKIAELFGAAA